MRKILLALALLSLATGAFAQPVTTQPNVSGLLSNCGSGVPLLGSGLLGLTGCGSSALGTPAYASFGTGSGAVAEGGVISAAGPIGSATVVPIITYNAAGQVTNVTSATITPAIGSITGLGTGVATALGVNVGTAGAFVVNGGALGTPSSGTLTSATGLPISTGLTGAGSGVLAAMANAVNGSGGLLTYGIIGTSGAAIGLLNANLTFSGSNAYGTPASMLLTNATGLPLSTGVTGTLLAAQFPALTGDVTTTAGSLATSITANAVTYAKLQQVAPLSLVGNPTGSSANAEGITLGSTLNFSGTSLNCTTATTSQVGCVYPDNSTITITAGRISAVGAVATSIQPGSTTVTGGVVGNCLYVSAGSPALLGQQSCGVASAIAINTTLVSGATPNYLLYSDSGGVLQNIAVSSLALSGSQISAGTVNIAYLGAINLAAGNVNGGAYGVLPVANGGSNCSTASITCFNNITGFTAAGTTGTTSTNLVFSTSPTLVTPVLGVAAGTSLALGGATIGSNALAVTGASALGNTTIGAGSAITSSGAGGALTALAYTSPGTGVVTALGDNINTNGGPLTGTTASVAAGALVVGAGSATAPTGVADVVAGELLASGGTGTAPAYTATPTLGASGTLGSLGFGNATSGVATIEPVTGALGTFTVYIPKVTTSDTFAVLGTPQTFTGTETLSGTSSTLAAVLANAAEPATVSATAATGTINYYINSQSILYYTSNASANWTTNFAFSSGTALDTALTTGQVVTVVFEVTQGSTAYYNSAITIDGNASGAGGYTFTTYWQGGTAPTKGNASGIDVYTYSLTKTGTKAYTILASQTQF